MALQVVVADRDRWTALEQVMATPGEAATCWCQVFRRPRSEWTSRSREQNRADLRALVHGGTAPGLLALDGDRPAGWCSVAPLAELPGIAESPLVAGARPSVDDLGGRWSVSCFVVREEARGRGVVSLLLGAAVEHARSHGARAIEGYPLDPDNGDQVDAQRQFGGTKDRFLEHGFRPVVPLPRDRTLMVRPL